MELRAGRIAAALLGLSLGGLQASCAVAPEGLSCGPMGECPKGQTCGSGLVCRYEHGACTTSTCGSGQYCAESGECLADDDLGSGSIDRRAYVGRVDTGDQLVLGTLIAPNVVATCSGCLGARSSMRFRPGPGEIEIGVREIEFHESQDVALLILTESLAAPDIRLGNAAPTEGANYRAISQPGASSERQSRMIEVDSRDGKYFLYRSPVCQTSGGPTLSGEDTSDVLVGVHATTSCGEQAMFADTAVVTVADWMESTVAKYAPASCAEVICYGCSTCVEGTLTCEPNDSECEGGTCDADALQCSPSGGVCQASETETVDDCGIRSCKKDGSGWNAWTVADGACGDDSCTVDGESFTCSTTPCDEGDTVPCLSGGCGIRVCDAGGTWGDCEANEDSGCPSDAYECAEQAAGEFGCRLK